MSTRTHCRGGRGTRTQLPMQWLAVGKSTGPTTTCFCPLYLSRSLCLYLSLSPSLSLSLSPSLSPSLSTLPLSLYFSCTSLFLPYLSLFLLHLSLFQCDLSRARAPEYTFFPFPPPSDALSFPFPCLLSPSRSFFLSSVSFVLALSRHALSRARSCHAIHTYMHPYIHAYMKKFMRAFRHILRSLLRVKPCED